MAAWEMDDDGNGSTRTHTYRHVSGMLNYGWESGCAWAVSGSRGRLRQAGLLGSMGRVASSVDNSMIESFWSTMQRELLDQRVWETPEQLASAIFEWIEAWYNPRRRHTSLEMLSPIEFEHQWNGTNLHTAAEGAA